MQSDLITSSRDVILKVILACLKIVTEDGPEYFYVETSVSVCYRRYQDRSETAPRPPDDRIYEEV